MPKESFNISIDSEVKKVLKKYAIDNDTDASKIIEKLIIEFLQKEKESY